MTRLMTILVVVLLTCHNVKAQCPPNIGFEDGTLKNWQSYTGFVNQNGPSVKPVLSQQGRQKIFMKGDTSVDKYGGFPVVCPNGSGYSVRLGNDETGFQAERLSYTYQVPPGAGVSLLLNYAVVLGDPREHTLKEQPRFAVTVYNVTDDKPVDCPAFDFIAATGRGFSLSPVPSSHPYNNDVQYRDWSLTTINLEGYGGKTIRLEFTTNDCTQGGHFGYAYFDIDETCNAIITGSNFCENQSEINLLGPGGFATYKWYLGTTATGPVLGTTPNLRLPVPPDQTAYTLVIEPYLGVGCIDTLHAVATRTGLPFVMKVTPPAAVCQGSAVNLKAAAITAGSSADISFTYYTDAGALNYLSEPENVMQAGVYYIKGVNPAGCIDIQQVEVKINSGPVIDPITDKTAQFPATVDITMPDKPGLAYSYFKDAKATIPLLNYMAVNATGVYYVRATSTSLGCNGAATPVKVSITPPLPFTINIPNTFTPNNDGINDVFTIAINGYVNFNALNIYNRYGVLIFTARSTAQSWDGNYKGARVPVGTYYYIFEGVDSYYKTPVRKSGSVTILR